MFIFCNIYTNLFFVVLYYIESKKYQESVNELQRRVQHHNTTSTAISHHEHRLDNSAYAFSIKKNKRALISYEANIECKSADICDLMDEIKSMKRDHIFTELESAIYNTFTDSNNIKPFDHLDQDPNNKDCYVCINCGVKGRVCCKCDI